MKTREMSRVHVFVRTAAMLTASVAGVLFVLDLSFRNVKSSSETGSSPSIGSSRKPHARNKKASRPHLLSSSVSFTTAYLGNGCFWARQKEFVAVEQESSAFGHRSYAQVTSLAGYAGSNNVGPRGLVCYHGGPRGTVYARLGDCEVVEVKMNRGNEETEMKALLESYFASFVSLGAAGMQRPDPQDSGLQYRSAIGIPGGIDGPLMDIVRDSNVKRMRLVAGTGGDPDVMNTVWIYDTAVFPFHRAEEYHQFHDGPSALKAEQRELGRIGPTGCPEKTWG